MELNDMDELLVGYFCGDGYDCDVIVSSAKTLDRDMHYNNLTISGTGSIKTNGWKIFVKEALDLTGAQEKAIYNNRNNGPTDALFLSAKTINRSSKTSEGAITIDSGVALVVFMFLSGDEKENLINGCNAETLQTTNLNTSETKVVQKLNENMLKMSL